MASETDFDGWRAQARALRAAGVAPGSVIWTVEGGAAAQVTGAASGLAGSGANLMVPRRFMDLAGAVILHRSPERFALLYGLLWRLAAEPQLLGQGGDAEVARARRLAGDVDRAIHKMKAFVRFHRVAGEVPETFVAWFEPAQRVSERAAPFFVRRFAQHRFSLMTPDVCVHWNGQALSFTPGADPADAPAGDGLVAFWRSRRSAAFDEPPDPRALRAAQRVVRDGTYDDVAALGRRQGDDG